MIYEGYVTLSSIIHNTATVPPPQSSGIVPLNDPFKTLVPVKYGQTTFRALLGYSTRKHRTYLEISFHRTSCIQHLGAWLNMDQGHRS